MRNADYTGWHITGILLLLNFLIALTYLLLAVFARVACRDRGVRRQYILTAVCVFLGPVVVPAALLLGHLLSGLLYRNAGDLAAVTFNKTRVDIAAPGDFETETNFVPIREALSINDATRLRKLMLDVLRSGADHALPQLSEALKSEDSETSHYAASAIVDVLASFRSDAARLHALFLENPEDTKTCSELLQLLVTFLPQGVLHDYELDLYTKMAGDAAETLYGKAPHLLSPKNYLELVNAYIDVGRTEQAVIWNERAEQQHPLQLETFIGKLRLTFEQHDNDGFLETLDVLKKSGVTVDSRTMELIRLFRSNETNVTA